MWIKIISIKFATDLLLEIIVSGFFNYNNNSGLHMLCIDNSHFFPSSLVIFANIYMKISLASSADFSTDSSKLPNISSTHSLFSALPHNHIPQPAVSSSCPRRFPTFRQWLPFCDNHISSWLFAPSLVLKCVLFETTKKGLLNSPEMYGHLFTKRSSIFVYFLAPPP